MPIKSDIRWMMQVIGIDYPWLRIKAWWTRRKDRRNVHSV